MSEEITPALTAEEWAQMGYGDGAVLVRFDLAGEVVLWFEGPLSLGWPHKLVAAGNAALPDGHPGKLTRADVSALRDMLDRVRYTWDDGPSDEGWQSDELKRGIVAGDRLAAILASLLPPEGR